MIRVVIVVVLLVQQCLFISTSGDVSTFSGLLKRFRSLWYFIWRLRSKMVLWLEISSCYNNSRVEPIHWFATVNMLNFQCEYQLHDGKLSILGVLDCQKDERRYFKTSSWWLKFIFWHFWTKQFYLGQLSFSRSLISECNQRLFIV